ncbi:MAG: hypothetical protein JSW64_09890 [Candidatus Zixiibacteriota bacterium]|nr:MAG: hypothetical protein JSW64_09890 [candidate division Zixibacteria bacterium]
MPPIIPEVKKFTVHNGLFIAVIFIIAAVSCSSVATRKKFYEPITADIQSQNFEAAYLKIEKARENNKYAKKDRLLYYLDSGFAAHYATLFDTSNVKLTSAEDAAQELFTKSISRAATSILLNDNVLEYSGEDYEVLYTNLLKTLNYLSIGEFDEAFVEVRRANLKLELLDQKYGDAAKALQNGVEDDTAEVKINYDLAKVRFNNDAFARYLSMHMYAADGKMDDARIDYDYMVRAFREQPFIYNFPMPDVKYVPESDGKQIVSVVGLAGLSPVKEAVNLRIRTDKDLGLVQVLYTDGEKKDTEYGHLPLPVKADYYFKFSLPKVASRESIVHGIRFLVDSEVVGNLQLIEDVSMVAEETFQAKKSMIYFRTIARAVFKGLATHKAKEKVDTGGVGGWLKKAAIDVGADITENADLRCSQLLPGRIYVGDFELEPGVYDLRVEFIGSGGGAIYSQEFPGYEVKSSGINLVEAVFLN